MNVASNWEVNLIDVLHRNQMPTKETGGKGQCYTHITGLRLRETNDLRVCKTYLCPYFHRDDDDVMKWKHFPRYWRFVQGIHPLPVNSPHKDH